MTVEEIVEELKKNPHFDENMKAFERFFEKVEKVKCRE